MHQTLEWALVHTVRRMAWPAPQGVCASTHGPRFGLTVCTILIAVARCRELGLSLLWLLLLSATALGPAHVAAQTDCSAVPLPSGYELVDPAQASQATATVQCTSSPAFTSTSVAELGCCADAAAPNMAMPYYLGWLSLYNENAYNNMTRPLCQTRAWLGGYPVWGTQVGCVM